MKGQCNGFKFVVRDEVADLKSTESKAKWREFCEAFKHVEDYNFATLLRLDASLDYEENNTVIATKVQFYAIELARNREGHNDQIRKNFKPKPRKKKPQPPTRTGGSGNPIPPQFAGTAVEEELKQILTGSHPMLKQ